MCVSVNFHLRKEGKASWDSGEKYTWVTIGTGDGQTVTLWGTPEQYEQIAAVLNQCAQAMRDAASERQESEQPENAQNCAGSTI